MSNFKYLHEKIQITVKERETRRAWKKRSIYYKHIRNGEAIKTSKEEIFVLVI